jgi:hypothetical protein
LTDIFDEVDEDLRRQQIDRLWKKYGPQSIAAFTVVILIAAGIVGWKEWRKSQARDASYRYQELIQAGEGVKPKAPDATLAGLDKIQGGLTPGYKLLAQFERANALVRDKRLQEAAKILDGIAADGSADQAVRDVATVKSAQLLADGLTLSDMRTRVGKLAVPDNAFRFVANELIGYAAFRVGDLGAARAAYQSIVADLSAPADVKDRAQMMLNEVDQRLPAPPVQAGAPAASAKTKP